MPKKNSKDYWIGPYGMRVPNHVYQVKAEDGGNYVSKDGAQTEKKMKGSKPTKEEYLARYAEKRKDGFYYWIE